MAEYYFTLPQITQLKIPQQAALNEIRQIALTGGPGTGKSVVSLWRHINNLRNRKNSLLLTYTTTLKMYFIGGCKNEANKSDNDTEVRKAFQNATESIKTSLKGKPDIANNFYEIIIDEAQDLPLKYYEGLKQVISRVSYGADKAQILYPEQCSNPDELKSIFPENIDYVLDENFRSTKRIMQFAKTAFPDAYIPNTTLIKLEDNVGELPVLLISEKNKWIEEQRRFETSNEKQDNAILSIIERLSADTNNIAVLAPWKKDVIYFGNLVREKIAEYSIYYEDDTVFPNGCGEIKNIHITTFKSAKGLEFDTVIIPNFDNLLKRVPIIMKVKEDGNEKEKTMCAWNDLYVGITRARSNLYLITNNDMHQFINSQNVDKSTL